MLLVLADVVVLCLLFRRKKEPIRYDPRNVMGDSGFNSDDELQKGGKLKLR